MENISRQAGRAVDGSTSPVPGSVADLAALARIQVQIDTLTSRFDRVDQWLDQADERIGAVEGKQGWRYTLRLTVGILIGVGVGFGAALLGHALGWLG